MSHIASRKSHILALGSWLLALTFFGCANKAQGPTGGPKDETPPKVVKSTPANGALNFRKKEVQIFFDENISIEKPNDNVLISPPQRSQPEVRGNAKIVTVKFTDELMDSTTYTINFGDAIVDLNEKNPLKGYRFSFSTGNEIDTLQISGTLLNAENLDPQQKTLVGIYREMDDSVFTQKPFLRIGKSNDEGRFTIDNIKAGTYKLFALADANRDYFYQPGEGLAMLDSLVTPTVRIEERHDTLWKDSVTVDTIISKMSTYFLPDDILLMFFKENKKRQYFVKSERKQQQNFTLFFNTMQDSLPEIQPLNFEWEGKYLLQKNATLDTLTYWLTDVDLISRDTLEMTISYLKSDSVMNLVPQTDTITVIYRRPRVAAASNKKKDLIQGGETVFYKFNTNASNSFDIYNPLIFKFESPMENIDMEKIHLSEKVDTLLKPLPVVWTAIDSSKMAFAVIYKWEAEKTYNITVDSTAFRNIYSHESDKYSAKFSIKSLDQYSAIKLFAASFDSLLVFQILDSNDKVVRSAPAKKGGTLFEHLKPGDYYMRAFIDENRNGKWDTGDLLTRRQPEKVFYNPKKLSLRANWEFEETWDLYATPLLEQKPDELKNKGTKKK